MASSTTRNIPSPLDKIGVTSNPANDSKDTNLPHAYSPPACHGNDDVYGKITEIHGRDPRSMMERERGYRIVR